MFSTPEYCPITFEDHRISYLDLGMMPLVNNLNDTKEESLNCRRFPLKVNYFPHSGLSMLSNVVDPTELFSNYCYKSGVNKPYIEHCKEMYHSLEKFVKLKLGDVCLDIGGNDGTLLKTFQSINNEIFPINVDPAKNLGVISKNEGIATLDMFWQSSVSKKIAKCKIITSTNVFQHTRYIRDFAIGVYESLTEDGVWCLEFPYWAANLETDQFDQIYHEHIYYYMVTPLKKLFDQIGLEIIDISEHSIHGGTMRIISRKQKPMLYDTENTSIQKYLKLEKKFDADYYECWGKNILNKIQHGRTHLNALKNQGKKIVGFGAAAKGCIYLNSAKLTNDTISYIVDDTDTKWHKFVPGTGIQIVSRETLQIDPPDYIVILAHNFADYIMESLRPIYKGGFIKMLPEITTYES